MPATAGPVASRIDLASDEDAGDALAHVERHRADADFLGRRAQQVRRADISAAGEAQIDTAMAAGQKIRKRDRPEQVARNQDDVGADIHGVNGASASRRYVGPAGERRLSYKVTRSIRHGPAEAGILAISFDFAARDAITETPERQMGRERLVCAWRRVGSARLKSRPTGMRPARIC